MTVVITCFFFLQKKSPAQGVFDQVLRQLSIVEREYFAFQYEDEQKNAVSCAWSHDMHVLVTCICHMLSHARYVMSSTINHV